jgi:carbamoylphosphate synthase large subunit
VREPVKQVHKEVAGTIAITGVGGGVGQAVLRALSFSSLKWRVVGCDVDPWAAGLYACDRGYVIPPAVDPEYIDRLIEVTTREQVQVLIPGSDPEVTALAAARDRVLSTGVLPMVGTAEAVELCRDKLAACRFFRENGLPFARTAVASQGFEVANEAGYPLVVKPVGGSASRGIAVVFDDVQLRQYIEDNGMIAQEYLVPESWGKPRQDVTHQDVMYNHLLRQEDEFSSQVVHDHKGELLGQFTSCNELKGGVPLKIDPRPEVKVEDTAREMASLLVDRGLVGPCNFQCKMTEKAPVFFEVNPRFTGITGVRAAMGFNEVEAVLRRLLLDEPLDSVRRDLQMRDDVVCSRYVSDLVVSRADLERGLSDGRVTARDNRRSL